MNGSIDSAFIGRVGNDPELKTSTDGKLWSAFNVAVGDGDNTQWIRVVVFGGRAEDVAGTLHKGDRVYIEGRLELRTWEKNGATQAGLNVAAWKCERLGQIGRNRPAKPTALPEGDHHIAPSTQSTGFDRRLDDEIPF